jgi:hypothetical protein
MPTEEFMFGNYACQHCIQDCDVLGWPIKNLHKHAKVFIICPGCKNTLELFACEIDTILNGEPTTSSNQLTRWSQWVDATLNSNPICNENKGRNRSLGLDQPEHYSG